MVVVGFSSCHERPVVLNVVDPGHFHASLLQKSRLEGVDEKVRVYAPEGEELEQYLATIEGYNTRGKQCQEDGLHPNRSGKRL